MISTKNQSCREPRPGGKNHHRWTPRATSFKKRSYSAESMTRRINGLSRAKPGCTLKNLSMRRRNEAPDPPPDLELDHSHAVGAGGNRAFSGRCVFWQRRGQPLAEPAAGKPAGAHNRVGDPREGARGNGTSFYRGGSAGGIAYRFLLGPQSFAERARRPKATRTHSS